MKVQIIFDTNNSAFDDFFHTEISNVLKQAKSVLLDSENEHNTSAKLYDSNGNKIGIVEIS
jgi:hypothetical protein